jgi:peptidoglycan hydrolase CwlO-like protein
MKKELDDNNAELRKVKRKLAEAEETIRKLKTKLAASITSLQVAYDAINGAEEYE